jgi:hypothetical protein
LQPLVVFLLLTAHSWLWLKIYLAANLATLGRRSRTEVWMSLKERVEVFRSLASLEASPASRLKRSLTKEVVVEAPSAERLASAH